MIINKTQINEVVLSVTDQSTLSAPINYLFEFSRKASNKLYYCIAQIATNYGSRQQFNIEDKTSPVAVDGEVDLPAGEYIYKVYQQASSTNIDPTLTTVAASGFAWVDIGILKVLQPTTEPVQYSGADNTNPVYNG